MVKMTEAKTLLDNELLKDEEIIWSGQPEKLYVFSSVDIFLTMFSIVWTFPFLLTVHAILTGNEPITLEVLFLAPFLIIGFYLLVGRFLYRYYKKTKTFYFVTNRRVLCVYLNSKKAIEATFIKGIPVMNKSISKNGIGTIQFGNLNYVASFYSNTGLDFFGSFYGPNSPVFFDIADADKVYSLVNKLRNNNENL